MGSDAQADRAAVLAALDAIDAALDVLGSACLDGFGPVELLAVLARREVIGRRGPAVDHRVLVAVQSQARPGELGSTTWPKVLADRLRISQAEAGRRVRDAAVLGPRTAITGEPLPPVWPHLAAAQAAGRLDGEHLAITRKFFTDLPATVDAATRAAAEKDLAGAAATTRPEDYRNCAALLLALLHPDGDFDDADRQRRRGATMGRQGADGLTEFIATLTPECRAVWEPIFAKLDAPGMCNPADEHPCVTGRPSAEQIAADTRTAAQRRHDAFLAAGRIVLATKGLGDLNGLPVTMIVTTTLAELETGAGVTITGGGSRLPMRDLIRNAAAAYHYLAVFDDHGQALHLGRDKRTASPAQRIMLHARDHGCTKPGCTAAGYRCQAHHMGDGWAGEVPTNVDDMTLACGPDNRMCTEFNWDTHLGEHGRVEWIPPPHLDHDQPRTNTLHHPTDLLSTLGTDHPAPPDPPVTDDPVTTNTAPLEAFDHPAPPPADPPIIEKRRTPTEPDPHDDTIFEYLLANDPDPDGQSLWAPPTPIDPHDTDHWPDDLHHYPEDSWNYHDIFDTDHDPTAEAYDTWYHSLDPDLINALDAYRDILDEDKWTPRHPCLPPDWEDEPAGSTPAP